MDGKNRSYTSKPLTEEEDAKYRNIFKGDTNYQFVRVGPAGYMLPSPWLDHSEDVRTMPLRPDDVFVVSFPRSGTTWTQELVWLLANDMNFDKAKSVPLIERFPFLEFFMLKSGFRTNVSDDPKKLAEFDRMMRPAPKVLASTPSPRFIKSHLPLSLLPEGTLDTAKVVYVARDPRDVAVSCYYFFTSFRDRGVNASFKEFLELFINDLVLWAPFFPHVMEAWQQRHHPNMLFLFYEELSKDLGAVARRVAGFLGKQYTDDQYDALLDHLKFDNFHKNPAVDFLEDIKKVITTKGGKFLRKGKAGGWRDEFDEEMTERIERWMTDRLRGTGLTFQ